MKKTRLLLQLLLFFSLSWSCNLFKEKGALNLLHISSFDIEYLIGKGYELEEGEAMPRGLSQKERINWLFQSNKSPISYLRYRNGDTTSLIFLNEYKQPLNHHLSISYSDSVKLNLGFQELVESNPDFKKIGTLNSENISYIVLDEVTNQFKLIRKDVRGTMICISHPVGL